MKRLSLVLLFSALAFCMLNSTGGNLHSEGQIAPNTPSGVQSIPSSPSLSPPSPVPLGVKITSHTTGQQVPTGQLTISGTSTDTPITNCEVYTDANDLKPMQKVAARGPGGNSDYSAWTFTYTSAYSLIKNGTNNLTSKISCIDSPTAGNLTKWNSVNITGVDGLVLPPTPPSIISAVGNSTNNTGLLISQSAALGTFDPTVATATTESDSNNDNGNNDDDDNDNDNDNDNSDNDNDNSDNDNDNPDNFVSLEEFNEEESNDDDNQQDNEEADEETNTLNDDEDSEEEDNDASLASTDNTDDETSDESSRVANDANDDVDNENNSVNSNPGSSEGNEDEDENNTVQSNSASNEDNSAPVNNEESSINENNVNENQDVSTNEEPSDTSPESGTNEDSNDEDECDIGDRGFPFCDGRID